MELALTLIRGLGAAFWDLNRCLIRVTVTSAWRRSFHSLQSSVELVQQTIKRYTALIWLHTISAKKWGYPCRSQIALNASVRQCKTLIDVTTDEAAA